MLYFTTWGSVRGGCCHAHRSLGEAEGCVLRDQRRCLRRGADTDRTIRVVAGPRSRLELGSGACPRAA